MGPSVTLVLERMADTPHAKMPTKATPGSACYDLYAAEVTELRVGQVTLVRTGFKMKCPEGYFLEIRPRSGLSTKGVCMANAPGTIDPDYAHEVKIPLTLLYGQTYRIAVDDRVAQCRLVAEEPTSIELGHVELNSQRTGGFGSTGR